MFDLALNTSSEIMAKIDICKYSVDFGEELCTWCLQVNKETDQIHFICCPKKYINLITQLEPFLQYFHRLFL